MPPPAIRLSPRSWPQSPQPILIFRQARSRHKLHPMPRTPAPASPQPANDDDADATVQAADVSVGQMLNMPQVPAPVSDSAPKSDGKPDKKADTSKTDAGKIDAGQTDPGTPADPSAQILAMLSIPPVAQAAVQAQPVASDGNDDDVSALGGIGAGNATPSTQAAIVPSGKQTAPNPATAQPAPLQTPANDTQLSAAPSVPVTMSAANDDGDQNGNTLDNAITINLAPASIQAGAKFTQVRNTNSKTVASQPAPQSVTLAIVADDTDAPAPSSQAPSAGASSQASAPQSQKPITDAAGNPAQNLAANAAPQANAKDPTANFAAAQSGATGSSDDSKPAHASASTTSQPDAAQPPVHSAADATPQTSFTINTGETNTQSGLSLAVHVANHDSDSQSVGQALTPNTDVLAVSIAARSLSGSKQFDIRLDPPELGRVDVRLSIDANGKTQAHMTADQPQTLALLQKDAPNLARALRDAGLDVSQNGLNFSLKGQGQNSDGQGGNFSNASRSLSLPAMAQSIEAAQSASTLSTALGNARLDIHV